MVNHLHPACVDLLVLRHQAVQQVRIASVVYDDVEPIAAGLSKDRPDTAAKQERTISRAGNDRHPGTVPGSLSSGDWHFRMIGDKPYDRKA